MLTPRLHMQTASLRPSPLPTGRPWRYDNALADSVNVFLLSFAYANVHLIRRLP